MNQNNDRPFAYRMDSEEEEEEEETFSFFFVLPEMNRCIIKRWPHHTKYGRLRVGSGEGGVNTVKGEATKKKAFALCQGSGRRKYKDQMKGKFD